MLVSYFKKKCLKIKKLVENGKLQIRVMVYIKSAIELITRDCEEINQINSHGLFSVG
jgi:hypothetical protein